MQTYYDILNVKPDATTEEIKTAYRYQAQKYHPDKQETGDEKLYVKVTEAYKILSNPDTRAEYDKHGVINEEYEPAIKKLKENMIAIIDNTQHNLDSVDLVQTLRYNTQSYINNIETVERELNSKIRKFKKANSKIKNKNKYGKNIFKEVIEERVERLLRNLEVLKKELRLARKMLEILDSYEYEVQFLLNWNGIY